MNKHEITPFFKEKEEKWKKIKKSKKRETT